jgi:hypothetical protein
MNLAARHPIALDKPAVNFFEGAVLGNGGMGVIVCTRADAVMLHFGHNDIWDLRIAEAHKDEIGTFQELSMSHGSPLRMKMGRIECRPR